MTYKTYECNSFKVHTIKTDRFKTSHMEIMFRKKIVKEDLIKYSFLVDLLTESSKKYPKRKDLVVKFEELYKTSVYGTTVKTGDTLTINFVTDFINPNFILDNDYLKEVLCMPFELIQEPNVVNDEFDLKQFNIIKERIRREITSISDNPFKQCVRNAFLIMDEESPTSYPLYGTIEELEKLNPSILYDTYKKLFKDSICDIFIIGNLDMDEVVNYIKKYFKYRYINNKKLDLYVNNKERKKAILKSDDSNNIQANMVMLYNVCFFDEYEKNVVFHVFNYIFGNGGLTSKLYKEIREEHSLCYTISSLYLKYDNLLLIYLGLDNNHIEKAIALVKKCLKEMVLGNFSDEQIEDAKMNLCISLDLSNDNNVSILNNYVFNYLDNLPLIDERKELYNKVTKEDIIKVAKKISLNTTYVLKGKGE